MTVETKEEDSVLTITRFDKSLHDRRAFSCGFSPIDNFLKSSLSDQIKADMVAAWMATFSTDPAAVLGFYTLGAMAVRASLGPKRWRRAGIPDIPVIYVRAVAVRKDMQGQGLGTALVVDAMKRCIGVSDLVGAAAIVLDVLEDDNIDRRLKFYSDLGFHSLNDPDNPCRVFMSMNDVRATLC